MKIDKQLIRIFLFSLLVGSILFGCTEQADKPNVLLIYSDDQGSIDLNCYGAEDLHTPNLDKLADDGIRFTQFYAGSSVCSPSRAALMTGMSPQAAGLPGNTSSQPGHPGMPSDRITIAEVLKEAGYATGHIGKWHMGYSDDTRPLAQGFDYSFGHMGGCIDNYSHYFYWAGPNRHDLWENGEEIYREGEYFPDMMTDKAIDFFEEHSQEPFFLYFAINLPHYPLQPTEKWREYYKDLEMPRRDYAGFISTIDERIGKLVKALDDLGLRENTIIIFQSDQGHSCETRAFNGGGNAGPYRGAKASLFEGGIRIPAIISWPEKLPTSMVNDVASINYDWFPTIAELCGIESIPETVEGKSLLPIILDNAASQHEVFHWKLGRQWAVRSGSWKLLGNPSDPSKKFPLDGENDQLFLVNLEEDIGEAHNLIKQYPDIANELINKHLEWEFGNPSDIPVNLPPIENIAAHRDISLSTLPHPKYKCEGEKTLINNRRGSNMFNDGQWLGFEGEDIVANIRMDPSQKISKVRIRFYQDTGSWIFLPHSVTLKTGKSGSELREIGRIKTDPELFRKGFLIKEYEFKVSGLSQVLQLEIDNLGICPDWHPGKGGKVWLFLDEILVE